MMVNLNRKILMFKVPIKVLEDCKKQLKDLQTISSLDSFEKKKKKANKLIKLLEVNYGV